MGKESKETKGKKSTGKKVIKNDFSDFKKKMETTPKLPGENFRNFVERIGVPSEKVLDFKQYLNGSKKGSKKG